jgi:hypothetical protein
MKRRRHTPEQIVRKLREADRMLAEGADLALVCRQLIWSAVCQVRTIGRPAFAGTLVSAGGAHRPLSTRVSRLMCADLDRMTGCAS